MIFGFVGFFDMDIEFHRIQEAYQVLSDTTLRSMYDLYRRTSIRIPFNIWKALDPSLRAVSHEETN
jgi:curved DNA-binding protein CbpA